MSEHPVVDICVEPIELYKLLKIANTFGLKDFYCDTKNNDNIDSDINVVIKNICK